MSTKAKTSEQETIKQLKQVNANQAETIKQYQQRNSEVAQCCVSLTTQRNEAVIANQKLEENLRRQSEVIETLRAAKLHLEGQVHGLESAIQNLSRW